jgi:hypothetical protein
MIHPELHKSPEPGPNNQPLSEPGNLETERMLVDELYKERVDDLEHIRLSVCLKFYNEISDKLSKEKSRFKQLLNLQDKKREILSHYTFLLNPYYFEQKFLSQK